ncbi:RIMS-binding protein 3A-like [Muntiacus reevesi]|uniref:RIMS-binding protein 3A-like n=1 Tax=Muntiacus reevesi TaxID=9886 RepID=UPI003307045A
MTKDSPSPVDGGRAASQKPATPGPAAAAALEEQRRELEKLRAELEAERARGRAERRRFSAGARQLREEAERERQQLADHLRSQWEAQRSRELRQLREDVLREREAEIRQLLRWKEAEMRQLQQVLRRERDGVARQARELQRQLAEELLRRGYGGGRAGPPEDAGARCRCRLQEVLAQLRWETHGEQASRIRHLQAALDVERRLFLKYILEHFHWHPALPSAPDAPLPLGEPPREAVTKAARGLGGPDSLSAGVRARSRSLDRVPAARARAPDSPLPARASSLDSLAPAGPRPSLDCSPSHPRAPESSSPDASLSGSLSPLPPPPPPPSERQTPSDLREGEEAGSRPREAPSPPQPGPDHRELLRRNSELSEALQELARRCSSLREENLRLRRLGLPDEADEKAKRLQGKRAELTSLARRLEDRARKLQEANLRAVSAPVPGESRAGLELCQALARQRARDLSEQASALLAKDKQIEELRQECHLLQARVASCLGPLTGEGAASAQWLSISDLDRLHRESQREVLRLQWQLTLQQAAGGASAEAGGQSAPGEAARRQVRALERELSARRQECEELGAQAAAAQRRGQEAEAQLQVALREGAWLAKENARLQAQADWRRKVAAENEDVRGQLGRACQQRDTAGLLAEQLLQQVAQRQDWQQQLQHDLQKVLCDLQAAQDGMWTLQCQPGHPPQDDPGTELQPGPANPASPPPSRDKQGRKEDLLLGNPAALGEPARALQAPDCSGQPLDSRPQPQRTGSQSNSSSEVESAWATVPSCPTLDADTASEAEDLEPDSLPSTLEAGGLEVSVATPKLKIFLARYSYNPFEGPNEHPESELPLTPGAHVYVFGDMDEDGFYEGELEDGRRGLVPSNLVEQIPDGDIQGCLPSESPDGGPTRLPAAGQGQAWKDDPSPGFLPGQTQMAVNREPCPVARVGSRMEVATEVSDTKTEASQLGSQESRDRRGSSNSPPGTIRIPRTASVHLHLLSVAATSAEVAWVGGSHPHTVYLDDREHALTPMGVNGYTFRHLQPGTRYQARVEVRPPCNSLQACQEKVSSTVTFETPLAGPPHPPLDVLVECHASPGLLVVSWLPVTIDAAGSSNGVPVTGYAVYADGLKVAEVAEATAGSTLLELSQLPRPVTCQKISVRTMSLCGESLDSVPAQIPHDCFTCLHWPEMSPFSYTWEHPSAVSGSFPICPRRLGPAPLSVKARSHAPRSCGETRAKCREAFPEELPRRWSPETRLISEGEGPSAGSRSQAQGPAEAQNLSTKDQLFEKRPQNHRPPLPWGQPGGEGTQDRWVLTSPSPAPGVLRLSPEPAPGDEPCQEKVAFGKVLRQKADAVTSIPPKPGSSQRSASDFSGDRQEDARGAEGRERRRALRDPSARGQALGAGAGGRLRGPGSAPSPAPSSKALGTPRCAAPPPGTSVGPPAGIFVALPDYKPLAVSTTPEAAGGELALRKGRPGRAGVSQYPHSFCRGECSGPVGSIAGHLVAEVDAGREWTDGRGRWHLLGHLDDFGGLAGPQGSSPLPQGSPGRPSSSLWTPKTMMAALDYDPRDWLAGGPVKGQLSLRAGDVVTVHGPVDDKGFYYVELGGHRGLVPAHLLDHMSLQE